MTNLWKRVLLTNIAVPVVLLVVLFPLKSHILLFILYGIIVTVIGSYEISSLIFSKGITVNRFFLPVINTIIFSCAYLWANNINGINSYKFLPYIFFLFLFIIISYIYARDIFSSDLEKSFEKISHSLFGILYIGLPSFFVPFLLNIDINSSIDVPGFINVKPEGSLFGSFLIVYLLICIWINDIFAYVFGITFGRNSKLGLSASPNKSLAGYIGGYFSTFIFVAVFYFSFEKHLTNLPPLFYFITPIFTGFLVPIGDLVESVFKRSARVKDSGTLILGRGGVLDSVDTLLYLIPLFFITLQVYFSIIG